MVSGANVSKRQSHSSRSKDMGKKIKARMAESEGIQSVVIQVAI